MKILIFLVLCLANGFYVLAHSQALVTAQEKKTLTKNAKGTFDVKLAPLPNDGQMPAISRMSIDKQFHGDLEGTSRGEMLAFGTTGYVAMEHVTGSLDGRNGTFTLQHSGTITGGVPRLSIIVVPESGTGELKGISGEMKIIIADGKHSYEFEYSFSRH